MDDEYGYLLSGKPLTHINQLSSIERVWKETYEASCTKSVFLSFDYIMLWYNCFASPEQVRVYPIADDGKKLIGFFPLILKKKGPFRVLSSLINDHCLHASPLVLKGYEDDFVRLWPDVLFSDRRNWDVFKYFGGYSFQSSKSDEWMKNLTTKHKRHLEPTYSILLPESFEEYFSSNLSYNVRHNVKKWEKKLAKFSSYNFCHYTGDEAVASWSTFLSIEDSGWKGQGGSSIKRLPKSYHLYYDDFNGILSKNDQLHMYFLEIDGQAIAGGFGYVDLNVFHYAKAGYVEDNKYSVVSPSNLLLMFIIEDLINNFPNVKRLNQFPWDYGYKHRYINEEAFCSEITLYSPSMRGEIAYLLTVGKEKVKLIPGLVSAIRSFRDLVKIQR
jgi:CelD/BcsL family acetyltransferase involved in cellulose biosynthesis